jgi:hypothetical protein
VRSASFLFVVAAVLFVEGARAAPNDITLNKLVAQPDKSCNDAASACGLAFRSLVRELGLVLTPPSLQPAETTGQAGFDFALDYGFHLMHYSEDFWQNARENPSVPLLMTLGARVRKGFVLPIPLASEVEFGTNYMIESSLLTIGTNIRVALNEGFRWIPDIAVQAGINRMVGNKDLDLLTVTAGGQISKGFGVMGSFNLCPYVGYQSVWVNGSSRIIDLNPLDTQNVDDNIVYAIVPLAENRMDRLSFGLRFVIAVVQITGGMDIDFADPVAGPLAGSGEKLQSYHLAVRGGVTF